MKIGDPICGEHGPRFVGYAEQPEPSLWQRWRDTAGIAVGIAAAAFTIMATL